jgi:molecular chaperone DnaK (HSP70)
MHCCSNVLVLRVGGQSTEMAVVAVNSGMYRILSSLEMSDVGGHQIDNILVEHFAAEFQKYVQFQKFLI